MERIGFVVVLALAAAGGFWLWNGEQDVVEGGRSQPVAAPAGTSPPDEALLARLDALERRMGELELLLSSASQREAAPVLAPQEDADDDRELLARLDALEAKLSSGRRSEDDDEEKERLRQLRRESDRASIEGWVATGRDPAADEQAKLRSLRALRRLRHPDGTDARLAVLPEMIAMAQDSTDGSVRADVWRQLSGVKDPSLLQPLLDALSYDEVAEAREEAAETLDEFVEDPLVEAALLQALQTETNDDVREQIEDTLGRRE